MKIVSYELTRFAFPRDRVIGDAQVKSEWHYIGILELLTDTGLVGTGFFLSLFSPLPALDELKRIFELEFLPSVLNQNPYTLIHRISRPRGGNRSSKTTIDFGGAINTALWDIAAKGADLPLFRYLGGTEAHVPVYASLLEFHLCDDALTHYLRQVKAQGFTAFKAKVGHKDVQWELDRLKLIQSIMGSETRLMIDANESWSPKETVRRVRLFQRAGIDIFWVEDPILREDIEGLRFIKSALPDVHLNIGEYVDTSGKRRLIESGIVDILNIHGQISDGLRIGWLAAEAGIPISLGNTLFEVGVHLAAALPECIAIEYAFHNFIHLLETPVKISGGFAYAPERPGHGLLLDDQARKQWACSGISDVKSEITFHPNLAPFTDHA
ncbi:MAG: mandelate racemase/muconate lactonizing enzyme family protein [Aggregatilineales bacterium]